MEFIVIFILSCLATFRISYMLSSELGPCSIFDKIRAIPRAGGCWANGLRCFYCQSVWWSGATTAYLIAFFGLGVALAPIFWMASSAACVIIYQQLGLENK